MQYEDECSEGNVLSLKDTWPFSVQLNENATVRNQSLAALFLD